MCVPERGWALRELVRDHHGVLQQGSQTSRARPCPQLPTCLVSA